MSVSMNLKMMDLSPEQTSAIQALVPSNMEEGIGKIVARAQGLQQELAHRRASLSQETAEAQEALLAEIIEEKWLIRLKCQSYHIYILHRLTKLRLSLKK